MIGTQCPFCKHYRGALRCAAFPDGIPADVLRGITDHTKAVDGDGGIRFEEGTPTLDESLTIPDALPGADEPEEFA